MTVSTPTCTPTSSSISSLQDQIVSRAHEANRRLRAVPFYARLLAGEVDAEEYAAFLVHLHKYVRFTVRGERGLAVAMAARAHLDPGAATVSAHAQQEAEEEAGHDLLLIEDLAALWGVSLLEARGRLEDEPTAPAVVAWGGLVDGMLASFPEGVVGVGLALETLATLHVDEILEALVTRARIPGIEDAVSFLAAHTSAVEESHAEAGGVRAGLLARPEARNAAFFYANAALALFEGIAHFLDDRFAPALLQHA